MQLEAEWIESRCYADVQRPVQLSTTALSQSNKYLVLWNDVTGEVDQAAELRPHNKRQIKVVKLVPYVVWFDLKHVSNTLI